MTADPTTRAHPVLRRLHQAINAHDVDDIVSCFAPDYRNETPSHPARSFTGRDQVRRNWTQILAAVPDLSAQLVRSHTDESTVWAEWDWSGTRADGARLHMRGVTVLCIGPGAGTVASARFYMEPVEDDGIEIDATVRAQVGSA